ncbi:DNA primase large subunit Spp2 [Diplodia seriata]|uniref:Pre-mRNA-splicing factor n=1 Tax=Diplodia seriata TaxID=420778 RepID=A0A1S8BFF4_9PEZI|nr:Pre-mRNA-splicing factor spp2 [Diplodia seriata]
MAAPDPPAKFSIALGAKKAAPQNTKKRPHSTLHDSDDEDEGAPQAQDVSHFDASAGGAIDARKPKDEKGPLVIKKQANRDWHAESQARKRQKSQLPTKPQANGHGDDEHFEEEKPVYGLSVVKKADAAEAGGDAEAANTTEDAAAPPAAPKTEDQLALEALKGEGTSSNLVVPIADNEDEAFTRDYELAPDVATLEDYEAVPVEQFGAAMLRGMGWKEGEAIGRRKGLKAVQPRVLQKRPALLGIGAKPDAAIAEELGAWGKGKGRGKPAPSYNPVVMRNKQTGEQYTEEELKQKIADQEAEDAARARELARKKDSPARESERRPEKSSRRHRYDEDDESDRRDKDRRRREKDSDRDYDSKHRSSRRDRDRDRSASDEDRYRKRKYDSKDYDRRDRDRDRDRDRKHRDRSRDDHYSKSSSRRDHRDRSRDKYRDSDRDRRRRRDD